MKTEKQIKAKIAKHQKLRDQNVIVANAKKEEWERVLKDIGIYVHGGAKTCDKSEPIDRGYLLCCADIQQHIKTLRSAP